MKALALAMLVAIAAPALAEERWETVPEPAPMPKPTESGYASVQGIEMYYQVFGSGEPVLLIHGGLGHGDIWASQVADLAKDHKVIVADSRGHGRSTRNAEPFGYDLMMRDYIALLDHLKIDKTALVGWSDGAIIGIDIAMKKPERLTRLFAHAANTNTGGVYDNFTGTATFKLYEAHCKRDYERLSKTPTEFQSFYDAMYTMWSTEPNWTTEALKTISVPTVIVLGDHDEAVKLDHTKDIVAAIPGATFVKLPNVGHFAPLQDPEGYNKAVRDFIDAK